MVDDKMRSIRMTKTELGAISICLGALRQLAGRSMAGDEYWLMAKAAVDRSMDRFHEPEHAKRQAKRGKGTR